MSKKHSSKPTKPDKPDPDFPLTAHPASSWCKKAVLPKAANRA